MFGKMVRWVAGLVLAAVVVVMVGVLLVPRAFGLAPYVVTSGSMRPTFDPGAVVLAKDVPKDELRVNDIITFQTPHGVTTHRVVQRYTAQGDTSEALYLKTQGDANKTRDKEPVDSRNVLGEVRFAVAGLGYVVDFVRTPLGLGLVAALFGLVAFTGGKRSEGTDDENSESPTERPKLEVVS
jgi:signal peptidase